MTVQPRNNPLPALTATAILPTITPPTPYASQKVTMTVIADGPVDTASQGQYLYFDFDSPNSLKQGIVAYPSLEDEKWLEITDANDSGPWTCTGIVEPDGVDDITWAASINAKDGILDEKPPLATDPAKPANMGLGKPIMAPPLIGSLTVLTPVTQTTRPTTGGSNQLLCTFKITDGDNNPITNPGAPFTATFTANGLPLADYFDFYMGETPDTAQLITAVTSDRTTVAVDTLPSDLTTLRCWVVPKANRTSAITNITASIGGYELPFGMVAIVDLISKIGADQYKPPMRIIENVYSQALQFSDDLPELHVAIDTSTNRYKTYQQGDCFLLVINNQVSKQSGLATFSVSDPGKVLFTIRPDEPLLIKGVGTTNEIYFVFWRPQGQNDLPPNIYHGPHITLALLSDSLKNPPKPGPVPATPNYDAPCIGKLEDRTTVPDVTLTSPVITKGIGAKIIWPVADTTTNQKPWTPKIGDSIAINLWIDGWDGTGKVRQCTQTSGYGPLTQGDVDSAFILIPLPESWFSDWGNQGRTGTGVHSKIQMQYTVTTSENVMSQYAVAISKQVTSYSAAYTISLNTIDPGSGH